VGRRSRGRRQDAFLATKFGFVRDERDPRRAPRRPAATRAAACDGSLKRLKVQAIALYYLHRVDPAVPVEDTVGAMAELVRAGKVRYLGLSEVSAPTLERAHRVHPITALQSEYSLWTRDPEEDVLATCDRLGVGFVAYSPLGRGFLTGALKSPEDFAADDYRRMSPRFQGENFARNLALVDKVNTGTTREQAGAAWRCGTAGERAHGCGASAARRGEPRCARVQLSSVDLATIGPYPGGRRRRRALQRGHDVRLVSA
jgi:aryl-alcohol dehydrogenase-like predicted oxidoreductase